jgi:hypothetical protein
MGGLPLFSRDIAGITSIFKIDDLYIFLLNILCSAGTDLLNEKHSWRG